MTGHRGVLAVRRGRAPNCSATGSVVGLALLSAAATAMVVNAFADRFWAWVERPDGQEPPRIRRDRRGSVLAWPSPPALLRLDPAATQAALDAGAVPVGPSAADRDLPLEVHVAVTATCPVRCTDCYLDAGPDRVEAPPAVEDQLEQLAAMGVFEVALGGGELLASDPERLFALADRCRALGLVPNLTTSGFGMRPELARRLRCMGQVNVSLDGVGEGYRTRRGFDGTTVALAAIDQLVAAGVRVGVNSVLGRGGIGALDALGDLLVEHGVAEWQWLRLKPAGRARDGYADRALTEDEALAVWPTLLRIEARTGLVMRVDCALVPFLAAHGPPVASLAALSVTGCSAGRDLWSIGADGAPAPCSFAHGPASEADPGLLAAAWRGDPTLVAWRDRAADPPEPCGSCAYREVCRGGCRVVSGFLTGDPLAPDPECPRVRACR